MINEVLYCERLLYLEWVQGEFADNFFTVDGRAVHTRADQPSGALAPPPALGAPSVDEDEPAPEPPPYTARSVWLSSERLGMTAKIDVVEGDSEGEVLPIEYKRGEPPDVPEGAWLPERAQVCAQVLLLRDAGYRCSGGAIWYAKARRRVPIAIDDALIQATLAAAARAREIASRGELPPPLDDSPKCNGCSLSPVCLPDEVHLLRRINENARPGAPEAAGEAVRVRRLVPARDDALPLYVQEAGARIGLSGECLSVWTRSGAKTEVRLADTSQVSVLGNVQVTTQALRALMERGIPVAFFSGGGWFYGRAVGGDTKNVELRLAQYAAVGDDALCSRLASGFVASKIRNCRTLLRRNHGAPDEGVLAQLEQLARKAEGTPARDELLGVEGTAARVYFGAFTGMLKGDAAMSGVFDLDGRNRRPPRDPINACLSFAYAMLAKDVTFAVAAAGLDPLIGFYHRPRFGRPALALDLMEELRPVLADSTVLGAVNTGVLTLDDFVCTPTSAGLRPAARKRLIQAYERRMDQLVAHPLFGYRVSYRRILEVQARLLGRLLLGEIDEYPEFRTR